jgi:hypothetical protein
LFDKNYFKCRVKKNKKKMKYIFLLSHADYDKEALKLKPLEKYRLSSIAKKLQTYPFEKLAVMSYPLPPMQQTIDVLRETLKCDKATTSLTLGLSYNGDRYASARNVASSMLYLGEHAEADAILLVSTGSDLRYIAQETAKHFLPEVTYPENAKSFYFCNMVAINIEGKTIDVYKRF